MIAVLLNPGREFQASRSVRLAGESFLKAEIVTIGDELITGGVVDTNSSFIARNLTSIGIEITMFSSVGDDASLVERAVSSALERSDLVIVTGGIGPTGDDITREAISEMAGRKLALNAEILDLIKERFLKMGLEMGSGDKKQAFFPEGAETVKNPMGTAWGFILRHQKKLLIVLPGVPRELKAMMTESIIPFLAGEEREERVFKSRTLKVFGITETRIEESLRDTMIEYGRVRWSFLPNYPENHIKITVEGKNGAEVERTLKEVEAEIFKRLGHYIFGFDDQTLESVAGDLLRSRKMTLAVAESCTGGLITHRLTNIPGSSDYLNQGVVAYSNQAKIDILGVPASIIKKFGAVSEQTARKMAEGVRRIGKATLGLAVTGVAGPGGGTPESPVGKVFIALADAEETGVKDYNFFGNRESIKLMTSQVALNLLRRYFLK